MILFRQGKDQEARDLFGQVEMKPLPADHRLIFERIDAVDDVLVWMLYKEAKALIQPENANVPLKHE